MKLNTISIKTFPIWNKRGDLSSLPISEVNYRWVQGTTVTYDILIDDTVIMTIPSPFCIPNIHGNCLDHVRLPHFAKDYDLKVRGHNPDQETRGIDNAFKINFLRFDCPSINLVSPNHQCWVSRFDAQMLLFLISIYRPGLEIHKVRGCKFILETFAPTISSNSGNCGTA